MRTKISFKTYIKKHREIYQMIILSLINNLTTSEAKLRIERKKPWKKK